MKFERKIKKKLLIPILPFGYFGGLVGYPAVKWGFKDNFLFGFS